METSSRAAVDQSLLKPKKVRSLQSGETLSGWLFVSPDAHWRIYSGAAPDSGYDRAQLCGLEFCAGLEWYQLGWIWEF